MVAGAATLLAYKRQWWGPTAQVATEKRNPVTLIVSARAGVDTPLRVGVGVPVESDDIAACEVGTGTFGGGVV